MPDDAELLRRYTESRSEEAFAQLVERNLNLVYFAALRRANGDTQLAEDVVQQVFAALARNARSVMRHPVLAGWLYVATRNAAANMMRAERRRKTREQEAALQENAADPGAVADWDRLRPQLDAALDELGARDRDVVLLRCLEDRPFAEIGKMLRISEDAARKRVDRALDKLRGRLGRRGVTSTSAALALALTGQVGMATPLGLAAKVVGQALAGVVTGSPAGIALATLMSSTKVSVAVAAAMAIAAGGWLFFEHRNQKELRGELSRLRLEINRPAPPTASASAPAAGIAAKNAGQRPRDAQNQRRATLEPRDVTTDALHPFLIRGMVRMEDWKNRGTDTPAAALESYLWAVDHIDSEVTGETIGFGEWKPKVDALYATVSEETRAKYDTPEKLCALALTAAPHGPRVTAFELVSQTPDPILPAKYAILHVRSEKENGKTEEGDMRFERTPNGWRRTLPDNLLAPIFEEAKKLAAPK